MAAATSARVGGGRATGRAASVLDAPDVDEDEDADLAAEAVTLPPPVVPEVPALYDGDADLTKDELALLGAGATISTPRSPAGPPAAAPPAPPADGRSRSRWYVALAGFLVLALLAVLGFLAYLLFRVPTHEVPDLTGLTLEEAEARIAEYEWDVDVQRERSDEEPDEGQVVRVVPDTGSDLADGEPFLIVVSLGPELRTLPELEGVAQGDAETALAELRLRARTAAEEFDEDVPSGERHLVVGAVRAVPARGRRGAAGHRGRPRRLQGPGAPHGAGAGRRDRRGRHRPARRAPPGGGRGRARVQQRRAVRRGHRRRSGPGDVGRARAAP